MSILGISLNEADIIRRDMSKKDDTRIKDIYSMFIDGATEQNIDKTIAKKIFNEIVFASSYSFNKSHSVAYALISYRMAYLKCHYKDEFLEALNNNKTTY